MARIESLNVLLATTGNDYLAEQYGAVIENVQKVCISQALKNTNLSGTPGAGTYEAKRFANKTSNNYGTARSGRAGQAVKAKFEAVPGYRSDPHDNGGAHEAPPKRDIPIIF
jgi:hypothetical protein